MGVLRRMVSSAAHAIQGAAGAGIIGARYIRRTDSGKATELSLKAIDRHLWQRFWAIASPFWRHEEKWKAWGLLALLGVLLLGQTRFAVLFNE